jgi:hypothetical protein
VVFSLSRCAKNATTVTAISTPYVLAKILKPLSKENPMSAYVEYQLEDGTTILIAAPQEVARGMIAATRGPEDQVVKAGKKFNEALQAVVKQAQAMRTSLKSLRADEVEVTFGLTTTGEMGNFAIGKLGIEANYEVTLKWKNLE